MANNLNSGYHNNINIIQGRTTGTGMQRYTDRAIDLDGNGVKEKVTIVTTPTGTGSKVIETVTTPAGAARTIIQNVVESDGGVYNNNINTTEYTFGNE